MTASDFHHRIAQHWRCKDRSLAWATMPAASRATVRGIKSKAPSTRILGGACCLAEYPAAQVSSAKNEGWIKTNF